MIFSWLNEGELPRPHMLPAVIVPALARGMVLAQAGTAMLAQANQAPQYILSLLRG